MKLTGNFLKGVRVNQVIQYLTYSDILMLSGWGLVSPIIAVFFTEQIVGGSVAVAGLATTIFYVTKSLVQIPVARFVDLKKGEWDDFWTMIIGSLIISFSAFLLIFAQTPIHIYLIQIFYGIGTALSYPSWLAIFTRHIDKKEEGLEWSLYYTATDLGAALTAGLGGFLAANFGYRNLFFIVGVASLVGTAFLAGVTKKLKGHKINLKKLELNTPS